MAITGVEFDPELGIVVKATRLLRWYARQVARGICPQGRRLPPSSPYQATGYWTLIP